MAGKRRRHTAEFKANRVHPYLPRAPVIDWSNQVWCADIAYIPMRRD